MRREVKLNAYPFFVDLLRLPFSLIAILPRLTGSPLSLLSPSEIELQANEKSWKKIIERKKNKWVFTLTVVSLPLENIDCGYYRECIKFHSLN